MHGIFIQKLKKRLALPLPGEDVQYLMAPVSRVMENEFRVKENEFRGKEYTPKKSAILILIFPENDSLQTILIERPKYDGVHSGQIAFPGGKFEPEDINLKQTALRESQEEIGVNPQKIEILGKLTDLYISPSNFWVSPFIGFVNFKPTFKLEPREVTDILTYDLFDLNKSELKSKKEITLSMGIKLNTPYYNLNEKTVWGATAMMISELNVVIEETKLVTL